MKALRNKCGKTIFYEKKKKKNPGFSAIFGLYEDYTGILAHERKQTKK